MNSHDLIRFFSAKVLPECPICKNTHWDIPAFGIEDSAADVGVASIPIGYRPTAAGLLGVADKETEGAVYAVCINCGFVRCHSKRVIEQWLTQNH